MNLIFIFFNDKDKKKCGNAQNNKQMRQVGAELGQAQVKLDATIEVIVEVGVEGVNLSSTFILVGGWAVKQMKRILPSTQWKF